jgi:hypothetical protein
MGKIQSKTGTRKEKSSRELTGGVSVRLDATTRYTLDLMSRRTKGSLSAAIEWSIKTAALHPEAFGLPHGSTPIDPKTLYHKEKVIRFLSLADQAPHLFNEEEEDLWSEIVHCNECWIFGTRLSFDKEGRQNGEDKRLGVDGNYVYKNFRIFEHNAIYIVDPDATKKVSKGRADTDNVVRVSKEIDQEEESQKQRMPYPKNNRKGLEKVDIPLNHRKTGCVFSLDDLK